MGAHSSIAMPQPWCHAASRAPVRRQVFFPVGRYALSPSKHLVFNLFNHYFLRLAVTLDQQLIWREQIRIGFSPFALCQTGSRSAGFLNRRPRCLSEICEVAPGRNIAQSINGAGQRRPLWRMAISIHCNRPRLGGEYVGTVLNLRWRKTARTIVILAICWEAQQAAPGC
jgi:hypothetical protein